MCPWADYCTSLCLGNRVLVRIKGVMTVQCREQDLSPLLRKQMALHLPPSPFHPRLLGTNGALPAPSSRPSRHCGMSVSGARSRAVEIVRRVALSCLDPSSSTSL